MFWLRKARDNESKNYVDCSFFNFHMLFKKFYTVKNKLNFTPKIGGSLTASDLGAIVHVCSIRLGVKSSKFGQRSRFFYFLNNWNKK